MMQQISQELLDQLYAFLRLKSVSPIPGFASEIRRCAEFLAAMMQDAGISASVVETPGNPLVYGETEQKPGRPTVLIYGHYDVQPEGDLSQWDSDPYAPELRNGRIYARGIGDNKGQVFAHVKGYEVFCRQYGAPNLNLKYLFEGEEESGSAQLFAYAAQNRDRLKADVTIWSDGNAHYSGRPVVILGLKGINTMKITASGPCCDIHSQYSSVVENPTSKVARILDALKGEDGRVRVPGFYDGACSPNEAELAAIRKIPGTMEDFYRLWQVDTLLCGNMEEFYTRYMYEPTLNCGCIYGGNPNASKNIIPHEAGAFLDIRTVPGQDAEKVRAAVADYIERLGISGVTVEGFGTNAAYTPLDHPYVAPVLRCLQATWGAEPILYPAMGGSGPFYVFNRILGAPCIMVPYADAEQHDHGPNESMPLSLLQRGIDTTVLLLREFSAHPADL